MVMHSVNDGRLVVLMALHGDDPDPLFREPFQTLLKSICSIIHGAEHTQREKERDKPPRLEAMCRLAFQPTIFSSLFVRGT